MAYPTTLDTFTDRVDNVDSVVAADVNLPHNAVEALEAKVGIDGSAVSTSHDYKLSEVADKAIDKTTFQKMENKVIIPPVTTYTPSAAGTATVNLALSSRNKITMPAGNITIALSNASVGQVFQIEITQDGTGSRTVTWFTTIKWAGGTAPTLTTTGGKRDSFVFICQSAGQYDGYVAGFNI